MRARVLACACALWVGGCLYPEYGVRPDGGAAGTSGRGGAGAGGRGGSAAGAAGVGGNVGNVGSGGSALGVAGSAGGVAGSAAGRGGAAGGAAGSAGSAGSVGTAGGGGASAGRGGTAGGSSAGTGGGSAGKGGSGGSAGTGGSAGAGGSAARGGSGGSAGTGGSAARGGSGGSGGSAGTGGSSTGTGGTGTGGSTAAPNWVPSIDVVYQFDGPQGQIGAEAHGDETLHMEEDAAGSMLPVSDSVNAIEGNSGKLGFLNGPAYFRSRSGASLPTVFQTEPGASFTMGGWFRIDSSQNDNIQYLINDEGPGNYMGGFVFYLDQQIGSFGTSTAYAYCRIGTSQTNFNYKEVQTSTIVGPDPVVGNRWAHLVCRYDASSNQLSIFVAGVQAASVTDTTHPIKTGPGPFIVGCDTNFCALTGNVDEVFYEKSPLTDLDIKRIYACGIDGSRCQCSGQNWIVCGYGQATGCGALPACNANP